MCGIIGYIGPEECSQILLEGLKRLEYRGYDSAGIALIDKSGTIAIRRSEGKLNNLAQNVASRPISGSVGIGHTRWATHGRPSEENAHPHEAQGIVVVHNGIIENHLALKRELRQTGVEFKSETDTEIMCHLIAYETTVGYGLEESVRRALARIRGSYAIAVLWDKEPDKIIAAKSASPLIIGLSEGCNFIASDIPAILHHTRNVVFLDEGEFAVVSASSVVFGDIATGKEVTKKVSRVTWSPIMAEKGGYKHFMLKEIYEQPRAIVDTIRGRISVEQRDVFFEELHLPPERLSRLQRIVIIACGTSYHAGLVGRYYLEEITRIPCTVELASEFRYRNPILDEGVLLIAISQSGETADTLAALKTARAQGVHVVSICNVVDSSIARESDGVLYTHAGPEIGVASTKAFTTQIVGLLLISIYLGRRRDSLSEDVAQQILVNLVELPSHVESILTQASVLQDLASKLFHYNHMLYLGRGTQFPIALEGALKLKEISYIHAEGYAAGEMKHGPIALIDEQMPVLIIVTQGNHYEKVLANLEEVKARDGKIIAVATEGDDKLGDLADFEIFVPATPWYTQPILTCIPLQLLAYFIADLRGTDVDQPRNLAKSVTVE